jgi:hypothetical protein
MWLGSIVVLGCLSIHVNIRAVVVGCPVRSPTGKLYGRSVCY